MLSVRTKILLACLPIVSGICGCAAEETAPGPAYVPSPVNPIVMSSAAAPASTGSPNSQSQIDVARERYDSASAALGRVQDDVLKRLQSDPQFAGLERAMNDAKTRYDGAIDGALSNLRSDREYRDLLGAADGAAANLRSLEQKSPRDPQGTDAARQRLDDLRRQIAQREDDVLDHDRSVQEARQIYRGACAARDKALDEALAADAGVRRAQAEVDIQREALDVLSAADRPPDQTTTSPASGPGPVVYDTGDYVPAPSAGYSGYAEPPMGYAPPSGYYYQPEYYAPAAGYYFGFSYSSYSPYYYDSHYHYHHDWDHHDGDHHDYHDGHSSFSSSEQDSRHNVHDNQTKREQNFTDARANQSQHEQKQHAEDQARLASQRVAPQTKTAQLQSRTQAQTQNRSPAQAQSRSEAQTDTRSRFEQPKADPKPQPAKKPAAPQAQPQAKRPAPQPDPPRQQPPQQSARGNSGAGTSSRAAPAKSSNNSGSSGDDRGARYQR